MNKPISFDVALDEVSRHSAGGAPFLIAYGLTFLLSAILALFLPRDIAALIAMFQGGVALPLAFWLERRMGSMRMSADNPLRSLSGLMAVSQALGLPALIVGYSLNPNTVPVILAALGGMHFLPYAWLHRTRAYIVLGVVLALGAFGIQILFRSDAFIYILFFISAVYFVMAPVVYNHARKFSAAPAM